MKLYLVPTPIGNLEDITLRAINILKNVDLICAEDTRTSGILLKHLGISKPMQSYHIFNEHQTVTKLVDKIKSGTSVAYISDAGTPSISDPGFLLVKNCIDAGIAIECLPGATAFVPALVNSGLPSDRFVFEGFLPHKKGRNTRLQELVDEPKTIIFYESPHRILKTLEQLSQFLGAHRQASLSRELTKMYEETIRGSLSELLTHCTQKPPKGEIVLVVAGAQHSKRESND